MVKKLKRYRVYTVDKPKSRKKKYQEEMEFRPHYAKAIQDLGDPRLREIQRTTNSDDKEAKAILTLEKNNPSFTLPELVAMNWLNSTHVTYVAQAQLFGGRRTRGGLVPDYMVRSGPSWMAWLINGDYYHSSGFQQRYLQGGRDLATKLRLEGTTMNGIKIKYVVMMGESDVYDRRPEIFELGMLGQELQ